MATTLAPGMMVETVEEMAAATAVSKPACRTGNRVVMTLMVRASTASRTNAVAKASEQTTMKVGWIKRASSPQAPRKRIPRLRARKKAPDGRAASAVGPVRSV